MDSQQTALEARLRKFDPDLADLYVAAVDLATGEITFSRMTLLAHSVRELIGELATVLSMREDTDLGEYVQFDPIIQGIADLWTSSQLPHAQSSQDNSGSSRDDLRVIPRPIYDSVSALVQKHEVASGQAARKRAIVIGADAQPTHPGAISLKKAWGQFRPYFHFTRGGSRALPGRAELESAFQQIEIALDARLSPFFDVLDALTEVIDHANRTEAVGSAEFSTPSDGDVSAALLRIGHVHHRRAFFLSLQNPNWITPLDARGAFAKPAELDGSGKIVPWEEGDYLARMATLAPESVAKILERRSDSTNPFLQQTVLSAASTMPSQDVVRLIPGLIGYINTGREWLDIEQLIGIAETLLIDGKAKPAKQLLNAMYAPYVDGNRPSVFGSARPSVRCNLSESHIVDSLSSVADLLVAHLGKTGTTILVSWLVSWERLLEHHDDEHGVLHNWRRSIRPHAQNIGGNRTEGALVEAIRSAARQVCDLQGLEAATAPLDKSPVLLIRRIALDLLADIACSDSTNQSAAIEQGTSALFNEDFLTSSSRVEYTELARQILPHVDPTVSQNWLALVSSTSWIFDEQIVGVLSRADVDEVTHQDIVDFRGRAVRDILAAVGTDSLPPTAVDRLTELETEHGAPAEHPEFGSWTSTRVGWESPISFEEFCALSPTALVSFLKDWEDPEDTWLPSTEGLVSQLRARLLADPEPLLAVVAAFADLDERFIVTLLRGLRESLDRIDNWTTTFDLVESYLSCCPEPSLDDFEEERYSVRREAASLLSDVALSPALAESEQWRILFDLLLRLSDSLDPTEQHERQFASDGLDPLTLMLSTTRPVALRGLIRLGVVAMGTSNGPAIRSAVLSTLDRHTGISRDASLGVQSVFGDNLQRLFNLDEEWSTAALELVLGNPADPLGPDPTPGFDAVWSVFISTHTASAWMIDRLEPYFWQRVAALNEPRVQTVGWRTGRSPDEQLSENVVLASLNGKVPSIADKTGLMALLFVRLTRDQRRELLAHTGWLLSRDDQLEDDVVRAAMELWDYWSAIDLEMDEDPGMELSGFSAWVTCGHFEISWWLPHLARLVSIASIEDDHGLGSHLLGAAEAGNELLVIQILQDLSRSANGQGRVGYDVYRSTPAIIARCLDNTDNEIRDAGTDLMNTLGSEGQIGLADRVASLRRPSPG